MDKFLERQQESGEQETQQRIEHLRTQIARFENNLKKFRYELSLLDLSDEHAVDLHRLIRWAERAKKECEDSLRLIEEQERTGDVRN